VRGQGIADPPPPDLRIRPRPGGNAAVMSQFEQENDLGRGGGEVDDDTLEEAWKRAPDLEDDENVATDD
jgi:hypothetical protein